MKKVEAIIRPSRLEEVKDALNAINITGITITQVMGCGRQKGYKEVYRGTQVIINVLPKIKLETVVHDSDADRVVQAIVNAARVGEIGDGKVFVYPIDDAVRIRTGERGDIAL